MPQVTKTISTTEETITIHFESFEDFMKYENHYDNAEAPKSETAVDNFLDGQALSDNEEPDWIDHLGSDECPVPEGSDCEVMFQCGMIYRNNAPEDWVWSNDGMLEDDIIKYRVWSSKED